MSAVLLAVFNDSESANHARTHLVQDGFPTDRVEVSASRDPGRAGLEPGGTPHERFVKYFETVCGGDSPCAERLASALDDGAATVTVHPRGMIEVETATSILELAGATELIRHDLERQTFEYAAARYERPWVRHFWLDLPEEGPDEAHCLYCRLFERRPVTTTV